MSRLAALAVLLAAASARAEETPATPAPVEADWSLGAGLGFGLGGASSIVGVPVSLGGLGGLGGLGTFRAPAVVAPTLLVEHRLSPVTWLAFSVSGSLSSTTGGTPLDALSTSAVTKSKSNSTSGGATLGLRRV